MATGFTIDFNANLVKFEQGIDRATKDLNKFSDRIKKNAGAASKSFRNLAAAVAGIAAGGALTALAKNSLDFADNIGKASERTGFAIETLQELRFAGDQTGLSIGEIDSALARFNKRLGLFRTTGGGAAAKVFKDLRINVEQLNEDVFRDIINLIGEVDNDVDRLALTTQFFGDEAQKLALTLKGGVSGIDAFARQARDLGLIMSEDLVRGAESANDQLSILRQVVGIELTSAIVELAPEIERMARAFIDALPAIIGFVSTVTDGIAEVGKFAKAIKELSEGATGFEGLETFKADEFEDEINDIAERLDILAGASRIAETELQKVLESGDTGRADVFRDIIATAGVEVESLNKRLEELNELRRSGAEQRVQQRLSADDEPDTADDIARRAAGINKLLEDLRAGRSTKAVAANKAIADSEKEIQTILEQTMTPLETYTSNIDKLFRLRGQLGEDVFGRALARESEAFTKATGAGEAFLEMQQDAATVFESTRTPLEEFNAELEKLQTLFDSGLIDPQTFGRANRQAIDSFTSAVVDAQDKSEELESIWSDLGFTMSSAFEEAVLSGGNLRDVISGLEQDIVQIILRTAVTKPLGEALGGALSGAAGGFFGDLLGGIFRADGGPVTANKPFIVGEKGPELFVPRTSGSIIPNSQASIVNNINVSTPTGSLSQESLSQLQTKLGESINRSLSRNA